MASEHGKIMQCSRSQGVSLFFGFEERYILSSSGISKNIILSETEMRLALPTILPLLSLLFSQANTTALPYFLSLTVLLLPPAQQLALCTSPYRDGHAS